MSKNVGCNGHLRVFWKQVKCIFFTVCPCALHGTRSLSPLFFNKELGPFDILSFSFRELIWNSFEASTFEDKQSAAQDQPVSGSFSFVIFVRRRAVVGHRNCIWRLLNVNLHAWTSGRSLHSTKFAIDFCVKTHVSSFFDIFSCSPCEIFWCFSWRRRLEEILAVDLGHRNPGNSWVDL